MFFCQKGVESKEDIQHLDHEIRELNDSNMKIEEDMMQLQTQVSIYSHELILNTQKNNKKNKLGGGGLLPS